MNNTNQHFIVLFIAGSVLLATFAFFLIYMIVLQRNKQNTNVREKQRILLEHQEQLTTEQERIMNEISKEVHDHVIHIASYIRMHLSMVTGMAKDKEMLGLLQRATELTDQVIYDGHNISHLLNTGYVKGKGLYRTMQQEMDHLGSVTSLKCSMDTFGPIRPMSPDKELVIFRIAQQAINNTLRHAQATALHIVLAQEGDKFKMSITDNGNGFDPVKVEESGIGFINMKQRAKFLNAQLMIASSPGDGCTIMLIV